MRLVVGGAATALVNDANRATRDAEARFKPHGIVLEEARRIAANEDVHSKRGDV